ncbi:MAG TPA: alpha/beta hydrolase, partial [Dehalococcoidia bacterium]
ALGLSKAVLMGLDLGGCLAAEAAAHDSHNISKLVLVAPTGLWLEDTPAPDYFAGSAGQMARLTWHDLEAAQAKGLVPAMPASEDEQRRAMLERQKSLTTAGKFLWPIPDKGLKKRIHRIDVPTLLVWGTSDGLVPLPYAHAFNEMIAGSRLALLEEAGHLPMLEQPAEFQRTVLEFLG